MAVMFGSLGAAFLGFAVFREHQWQTWQRLLASPAPLWAILTGKILVPVLLVLGQQMTLLLLAVLGYDVPWPSSILAYAVNAFGYAACVCALGLLGATLCQSLQQLNAIIHVGALLLAASCGAFIPLAQMPGWLQPVAGMTPGFWLVDAQKTGVAGCGDLG